MSLCGHVSSLLIPQDTNDEDVALFDAEEDAGKRSKSKIKYVNRCFIWSSFCQWNNFWFLYTNV